MEKKKWVKLAGFAMVVLLSLFVLTGCNNAVEEIDDAGYVMFTDGGVSESREISTEIADTFSIENFFWTYVAIKKDGLHTVGASETTDSHVDGKTMLVNGREYILKPVAGSPMTGLSMNVGPFSWGDWDFYLYGFKSYDEENKKYVNQVYSGSVSVQLNRLIGSQKSVPVTFDMSGGESGSSTGSLSFGRVYVEVPQDMVFYHGGKITVSITDNSDSVAAATVTLDSDKVAGNRIPVVLTVTKSDFAVGVHNLKFDVKYELEADEDEYSSTLVVPIIFSAGSSVILYGNLSNITTSESVLNRSFGVAVAVTGWGTADMKTFVSLADAVKEVSSGGKIYLVSNIENVGEIDISTKNITICPDGHFFKNLVIKDTTNSKKINIEPNENGSNIRHYSFYGNGAEIVNFVCSGMSVWIETVGGTLDINSAYDNVYHTGKCDKVNVTSVYYDKEKRMGYYCGADVGELNLTRGSVFLGGFITVDKLVVKRNTAPTLYDGTTLRGSSSTIVNRMYATNGAGAEVDITVGKVGSAAELDPSGTYAKISFKPNGGTGTDAVAYGIDGVYGTLPLFSVSGRSTVDMFTAPSARNGLGTIKFVLWNTRADASGIDYANGSRLIFPEVNSNLYAMWGSQVGGKIIYVVDNTGFENIYKFYTISGTAVQDYNDVQQGTNIGNLWYVFTCQPTGYPNKDKYYVFNGNYSSRYSGNNKALATGTITNATSLAMFDVVDVWPEDWNTAYIGHGKTTTVKALNCTDTVVTGGYAWTYVKNKNTSNYGGNNDWFIPSISELYQIYANGWAAGWFTKSYSYFSCSLYSSSGQRVWCKSWHWSFINFTDTTGYAAYVVAIRAF